MLQWLLLEEPSYRHTCTLQSTVVTVTLSATDLNGIEAVRNLATARGTTYICRYLTASQLAVTISVELWMPCTAIKVKRQNRRRTGGQTDIGLRRF